MRRALLLAFLGLSAGCSMQRGGGEPQRFVVFFTELSAAVDEPANRTINAAAEWALTHQNAPVTVIGFADPDGGTGTNTALSRTRAEAVADGLVRAGVNRSRIAISARGATDFTLSRLESRRVEIDVSR